MWCGSVGEGIIFLVFGVPCFLVLGIVLYRFLCVLVHLNAWVLLFVGLFLSSGTVSCNLGEFFRWLLVPNLS